MKKFIAGFLKEGYDIIFKTPFVEFAIFMMAFNVWDLTAGQSWGVRLWNLSPFIVWLMIDLINAIGEDGEA